MEWKPTAAQREKSRMVDRYKNVEFGHEGPVMVLTRAYHHLWRERRRNRSTTAQEMAILEASLAVLSDCRRRIRAEWPAEVRKRVLG